MAVKTKVPIRPPKPRSHSGRRSRYLAWAHQPSSPAGAETLATRWRTDVAPFERPASRANRTLTARPPPPLPTHQRSAPRGPSPRRPPRRGEGSSAVGAAPEHGETVRVDGEVELAAGHPGQAAEQLVGCLDHGSAHLADEMPVGG